MSDKTVAQTDQFFQDILDFLLEEVSITYIERHNYASIGTYGYKVGSVADVLNASDLEYFQELQKKYPLVDFNIISDEKGIGFDLLGKRNYEVKTVDEVPDNN